MQRILKISSKLLKQVQKHGEASYPEEGAGLLLGSKEGDCAVVRSILPLPNSREGSSRHNRYLITPQDLLKGEQEAARRGIDVIGVFHSHPDHPDQPSAFDREWALPNFAYMISSIYLASTVGSRSWRLSNDRKSFEEEIIYVIDDTDK